MLQDTDVRNILHWRNGDRIITAYAEHVERGARPLVRVLIRGQDDTIREESLQPVEQSSEMKILFNVCEEAHLAMTYAVERLVYEK